MADDEAQHDELEQQEEAGPTPPKVVEYDPITGVPSEFNEFLPKDSEEYKRWKAAQAGGGPEGAIAALSLADGGGGASAAAPEAAAAASAEGTEKKLPGGKTKKKNKPQVVLETNTRNKKKCVTTIHGLDTFGVKLSEAAKMLGKKFACGASVVKTASGTEQIDMQGEFVQPLADVLLKTYGASHKLGKPDLYYVVDKKKTPLYDDEEAAAG